MAQKNADEIGLLKRMKPANVHLQLAYQSIIKPRGIVEDVLVKVDKFILPGDFMILDMEEDKNMPILFGRPLLATGDVTLQARDKTVTFRVNGEEVTLKGEGATKKTMDSKACSEETPKFEFKPPKEFKFVFVGEDEPLPILISAHLKPMEEKGLVAWLKKNKGNIKRFKLNASDGVSGSNGKENLNGHLSEWKSCDDDGYG